MSYVLYTVEGLVLSSYSVGEASSVLLLLTSELGLVRVWVQGAKKSNSKLAPHTQDLDVSRVTLVKGREYWRLTDAEKKSDFTALLRDVDKRAVLMRITQIVHRLAHENTDPDVYRCTRTFLEYLEGLDVQADEYKALEIIFMLKILGILGYTNRQFAEQNTCTKEAWASVTLDEVMKGKKEFVQHINRALRDSHL